MTSQPELSPPAPVDAVPGTRRRSGVVALALFMLVSVPAFYLFSYNSGYGHDAVEYLVIGRSLTQGHHYLDLIPSKGIGCYAIVAGLISIGSSMGHASLSGLITAIYAVVVLTTFVAVSRKIDAGVGASSGGPRGIMRGLDGTELL